MHHLLHGVASAAKAAGAAAHDDTAGIQHHHHVAGIAFALDRLHDDAVTVLVHQAPGISHRTFLGIFFLRNRGHHDQRGVCFHILLHLTLIFNGSDLFIRKIQIGQEANRTGLPDGHHKQISRRGRGTLGNHIHHTVQSNDHQKHRFQQHQADTAQHPKKAPEFSGFLFCFRSLQGGIFHIFHRYSSNFLCFS